MTNWAIANDTGTHRTWLNGRTATGLIDPANVKFLPDTATLNGLPPGSLVHIISPATLSGAAATLADAAWAKAKTGAIVLSTQQF
jgi:hypothetical protein